MRVKACCIDGNKDALAIVLNQHAEQIAKDPHLGQFVAAQLVSPLLPAHLLHSLLRLAPALAGNDDLKAMLYAKSIKKLSPETLIEFLDATKPAGKTLSDVAADLQTAGGKQEHLALLALLQVLEEPKHLAQDKMVAMQDLKPGLVSGAEACLRKSKVLHTMAQGPSERLEDVLQYLLAGTGPLGSAEMREEAEKQKCTHFVRIEQLVKAKIAQRQTPTSQIPIHTAHDTSARRRVPQSH